ncbi:MAG TPA: prenyltransferase/squalene oxidase repeat-containing protein [Planctomycetota bacterium]|nr:prenyltransferase/squalene oxidase repeat-containing protein [Planctomycetota bacterium]
MTTHDDVDPADDRPEPVIEQKRAWFSNAPWWMLSMGLHAVLILGATLVAIEKLIAVDEGEVTVMVSARSSPMIQELERPRDVFDRKGMPKDDQQQTPTDEPAIFFPEAKLSDHNESDDHEETRQMRGDGFTFLSYTPGQAPGIRGRQAGVNAGVYDTMGPGVGGGGSGRYGGRIGGHANLVAAGGGSIESESAVTAALRWLARHQGPEGGWAAEGFPSQCTEGRCGGAGERDYDAGVTGLSILAFLGAGYSQLSKDEVPDPLHPGQTFRFGQTVKRGLQWLLSHQDPEGCVGERGMKYMYSHCVAALALSEAYGMTVSAPLREPAQKAVDFVVACQNPGRGWRYSAKCGDNDTSVTGWAIMALKSAELSDLSFPRSAYEGALAWLNEATETAGYARVGYNGRGTGKVYVPGKNEQFDHHESMSAVAVMSRIFMQKRRSEPALNSVNLLVADLPEWKPSKIDFYYWYYSSMALFQFDGPDGGMWRKWNEPMRNTLVASQKTRKDGCSNGSWNSDQDRWGAEGGRVYATALNAMTLEVYYRLPNVFGSSVKK